MQVVKYTKYVGSPPIEKRNFLLLPWLVALRKRSICTVVKTTMANLMVLHRTRNRRLPAGFWWTDLFKGLQGSGTDQSLPSCRHSSSHDFRRVLSVLGSLLVFLASSATEFARLKVFTLRIRTNPTLSLSLFQYNECPCLYDVFGSFGDRYFISTNDHLGVPAKPPSWYCGDGLP